MYMDGLLSQDMCRLNTLNSEGFRITDTDRFINTHTYKRV